MKTAERMRPTPSGIAAHYGRPKSELAGYSGVMAAYLTGMGAIAWELNRRGRLPERIGAADLALVALATHKLSRTITKDAVTSPFRAPFVRFDDEPAPPGEVGEQVPDQGVRKAVGELVSCPFCMDHWVASGFMTGLVVAPRLTRFIAGIFAARAGADLLQFAYSAADQATS